MIKKPFGTKEDREVSRFMQTEMPAYRIYLHSPADDKIEIDRAINNNLHVRVKTVDIAAQSKKSYTRSINMTESQFKINIKDGLDSIAKEGERVVSYTSMSEPLTEGIESMPVDQYLISGLDREDKPFAMALNAC